MAARARHCLKVRTAMAELQAVVADAAGLPVYVAEVEAVGGLLAKAQDWLKRAAAAASQVSNMRVVAVCSADCLVTGMYRHFFCSNASLCVCVSHVCLTSVSFCFVLL